MPPDNRQTDQRLYWWYYNIWVPIASLIGKRWKNEMAHFSYYNWTFPCMFLWYVLQPYCFTNYRNYSTFAVIKRDVVTYFRNGILHSYSTIFIQIQIQLIPKKNFNVIDQLGTVQQVQRLPKKETHGKGGRGGPWAWAYFWQVLGDVEIQLEYHGDLINGRWTRSSF